MDPNETLRQLRDALEQMQEELDGAHAIDSDEVSAEVAQTLAARITDLDQWLSRGGFLPAAWARESEDVPTGLVAL